MRQVGSGSELSVVAVQYGTVLSVVAQFDQQAAILKPLNQTRAHIHTWLGEKYNVQHIQGLEVLQVRGR